MASRDLKCFALSTLTPNIAHAFAEGQRPYVDMASTPDAHHAEQHPAVSNINASCRASGLMRAVHTILHTWTAAY